jgi:hypothetical protein
MCIADFWFVKGDDRMKRAAKKKRPDAVQTAVRLPAEMLERLRRSPHGITEGIKRGVTLMFEEESLDATSRELLSSVADFVQSVELEAGAKWHEHAGAHEILRLAILKRLSRLKPPGATAFGARRSIIPSDDPDVIAGMIEYTNFRMLDPATQEQVRAMTERNMEEMRKLHDGGEDKS